MGELSLPHEIHIQITEKRNYSKKSISIKYARM